MREKEDSVRKTPPAPCNPSQPEGLRLLRLSPMSQPPLLCQQNNAVPSSLVTQLRSLLSLSHLPAQGGDSTGDRLVPLQDAPRTMSCRSRLTVAASLLAMQV